MSAKKGQIKEVGATRRFGRREHTQVSGRKASSTSRWTRELGLGIMACSTSCSGWAERPGKSDPVPKTEA